ncbi:anti-CBASS protein Acb1 family protein [Lactiplantibacillus nangangensis]|uniref:Anti-CBASS protein Acb1 family protein n=1 Tax=Lactiplantibacillus nangangensis TaxID=2559917 RepID=A0ABW1SLP0_9LACO|nr:anti-CBASS Acb1 family protein [Lactiplantibacillus nangangensis]
MKLFDLFKSKSVQHNDSQEFNDFMAGMGKSGARDGLAGQHIVRADRVSKTDLSELYKTNPLAKKIVDMPADDLTKSGWTLTINDASKQTAYNDALNALNPKKVFADEFRLARLYGDGYIAMGLEETGTKVDTTLPLDISHLNNITYLNAFSSKIVQNSLICLNPWDSRYGQEEAIQISTRPNNGAFTLARSPEDADTQPIIEVFDASRYFHHSISRLEDDEFGTSLLQTLNDAVKVGDSALWSVGQILFDYVFKVYKSQDAADLSAEQRAIVSAKANYQFHTNALAVIGNNEDLTKEATTVTGAADLLDFVWDYLSMGTGIPKTILKGQSAGTVAGAQYDSMTYYGSIAATQENELRPQLETLIKYLMQCPSVAGGTDDPDKLDWKLTFNPMWQVDELTDAQARQYLAQSDVAYIQNGVIGPDEIAAMRFPKDNSGAAGPTLNNDAMPLNEQQIKAMAKQIYSGMSANQDD